MKGDITMKVYLVSYNITNWAAAYNGEWNCGVKVNKYFSTKDKAEKFIKSNVYETDPHIAKKRGEGKIIEIDVE